MATPPTIDVDLVLALAKATVRQRLAVIQGTTIGQALGSADLDARLVAALKSQPVGLFGRVAPLDTVLQDGDRIEIYRPLEADPKEARRRRARKRGSNAAKVSKTA